jgi:molecular chaperone GrpE
MEKIMSKEPKDMKKNKESEKLQVEFDELKSLLQRTQADFVNYRRRNEEDKATFVRFATSDLIEQILPVMDNFALAAKHVPAEFTDNAWAQGVQAIEKQLEQILLANGLEKEEVEGQPFDPTLHEAVGEVTDKSKKDSIIVSEETPGYMLGGKLIRPAKVIVNKLSK